MSKGSLSSEFPARARPATPVIIVLASLLLSTNGAQREVATRSRATRAA